MFMGFKLSIENCFVKIYLKIFMALNLRVGFDIMYIHFGRGRFI